MQAFERPAESRAGRHILHCGPSNTVRIWDADTAELLTTIENRGGRTWQFSPGDRFLMGGGRPPITAWKCSTWESIGRVCDYSGPAYMELTRDGKRLAVVAYDRTRTETRVVVYDVRIGEETITTTELFTAPGHTAHPEMDVVAIAPKRNATSRARMTRNDFIS